MKTLLSQLVSPLCTPMAIVLIPPVLLFLFLIAALSWQFEYKSKAQPLAQPPITEISPKDLPFEVQEKIYHLMIALEKEESVNCLQLSGIKVYTNYTVEK